jgi:predicted DNA-binding transcriptional regulator AlpA
MEGMVTAMSEWSVYLRIECSGATEIALDDPDWEAKANLIAEIQAAPELERHHASLGVRDGQITVQAWVEADDMDRAVGRVYTAIFEGPATQLGEIGAPIEVHVQPWADFEADVEQSTVPDLVSGPEVAEILGVSRQRVHQLAANHPQFPQPLYRLGVGSLWVRAAIERFAEEWERKPGRPRKSA